MRLRQVALVARDLESATQRLGQLLGIDYGYHDPGIIKFGLDNWVAAIGDTFLEVVSPVQDETTAGRFLERRGGDGGYMVILQTDSLEKARQRIEGAGARIVWEAQGDGPAGEKTLGLHIHPRDCGGAILSVDESTPTEAWVWAGPEWQSHDAAAASMIMATELAATDPATMAERWSELLGGEVREGKAPGDRPAWILELTGSSVRFVHDAEGRGDAVIGFDVATRDETALEQRLAEVGIPLGGETGGVRWADEVGVRVYFQPHQV